MRVDRRLHARRASGQMSGMTTGSWTRATSSPPHSGIGFRVWGLGFGVWGLGLGFRV